MILYIFRHSLPKSTSNINTANTTSIDVPNTTSYFPTAASFFPTTVSYIPTNPSYLSADASGFPTAANKLKPTVSTFPSTGSDFPTTASYIPIATHFYQSTAQLSDSDSQNFVESFTNSVKRTSPGHTCQRRTCSNRVNRRVKYNTSSCKQCSGKYSCCAFLCYVIANSCFRATSSCSKISEQSSSAYDRIDCFRCFNQQQK